MAGSLRRTDEALHLLDEARTHLPAGPRTTAAGLEAASMAALTAACTAAQAHRPPVAGEFAGQTEEITYCFAVHPHTEAGRPRELTADQCALYRIGTHRHLDDIDTALATARRLRPAQLPTAERRARAATDTARALLDAAT
ncbi:hypothetical protein [Streptomyces buecherae]|uniref:hypothetical protein n=1 Tax=Streptomyces buecherae TaxID=2763006 RepID=UPI0037B566CF